MSNMSGSNEQESCQTKYPPRELRFDNPYGQVAAVEYGNPAAPHKILCVHGWLDNAGSFEELIPNILDHENHADLYHIVALDMPGVGLSSHLPTGATYGIMTPILEMRRIIQKLKWERVTLISHSLGAHLSYIYSCMYPKEVDTMVALDLPHPNSGSVNFIITNIVGSVEEHYKCEYSHGDDPTDNMGVIVYSREDAIDRIMKGHSESLTRRSAEIMLKRGARKERWGYTFNRDVRLRYFNLELTLTSESFYDLLSFSFRPNLFSIVASRSPYQRSESMKKKFYDLYEKKCPIFREVTLDGTHHVHMNEPVLVAKEINQFLELVRRQGVLSDAGSTTLNKL